VFHPRHDGIEKPIYQNAPLNARESLPDISPMPLPAGLWMKSDGEDCVDWERGVRYAQNQEKTGFLINVTTVLPPSGLVGDHTVALLGARGTTL